jgi:RHS repeat-associated protein
VVTTSFFNSQWQELETLESQPVGCVTYIWGLRYIDDLILRERVAEKLYSLADPNWNVVAVCDSVGMVHERMKYHAFGKVTWLNAVFATKVNSSYAWNRTFTGQVFDIETGLMLYRNRYYHTGLGRFMSRDLIGYDAEDVNIYRYCLDNPIKNIDEYGDYAQLIWIGARWVMQKVGQRQAARAVMAAAEGARIKAAAKAVAAAIVMAAADATKDRIKSKCRENCEPCIPPAGTIMIDRVDKNQGGHYPAGDPHTHLLEVNQNANCDCFTNKCDPEVLDGDLTGIFPQKTEVSGGGPKR